MIQSLYSIFLKHPEISIDTRSIKKGSLFFALKGSNFNANKFAINALNEGAAFAVVDEEKYVLNDQYILVNNVLETLQNLANYHRKQLTCPVLAITGSNGKTTSKELIYRVISKKYKTSATIGNYNNHIGVPLSLLSIKLNTEFAIIEMGANHEGEIDYLCTIADPDFGVITNIGKAHLEGFGSLDGVLRAKTELYKYLDKKNGVLFIKDNQQILLENIPKKIKHYTYGQLNTSDYTIKFVKAQPNVTVSEGNNIINTNLIGDYNFDNISLSIAIGLHFGINRKQIKSALELYVPTNNRSQIIKKESNTILLDAYNANPMSVEKAVLNLRNIEHSNKVLILGDMFELGQDSKKEHINIINQCLSLGFTNVKLVGEIFSSVNHTDYEVYRDTNELITSIKHLPIKDSFVLIKGSRGLKLEQLVQYL
tara:strand:+ start:1669 stop:2943 length:1275 start_codon:yes stop_codon:yes gene_type:complete